ncbi:MAG: cytochrome-c oxidase, cbb3-type subunit III [Pseudomonadota bacterium]
MADQDNKRIDEPTGTEFVGHEWDGIEELDTPMPRWWLWTFYATIIWGLIYVVLYPAWPLVQKSTEGVLGWSSRGDLRADISAVEAGRADIYAQIAATPIEELPANQALMGQAVAGGAAAYKVNCVQCHGAGAAGYEGLGYPNLNDDDWLWGGTLSDIEYTLVHGIRWEGSRETRQSYMPAFEGIFDSAQVDALVGHIQSFSGERQSSPVGAELYDINCSSCHQPGGAGDPIQGAPALNDEIWLYGESEALIRQQILNPRHGVMPGWSERLDPVTIKMLAAYVHTRGGGQAPEPEEAVSEDATEVAAASDTPAAEGDDRS